MRPLRLVGLIAITTFIVSCSEPQKPVPSLNPEASAQDEAEPTATVDATQKQGLLTRMRIGDLYQLTQSNAVLVYDVRPKLIYSLGHIPRAISWPKADFKKDLDKHEGNISAASKSNKPVVIYCTDLACPDAAIVAKALSDRGHNVSILQGGYDGWKKAVE
ncbi:MAG: rhodanese-like domain-containing protein [Luteolibacter sp.]